MRICALKRRFWPHNVQVDMLGNGSAFVGVYVAFLGYTALYEMLTLCSVCLCPCVVRVLLAGLARRYGE